MTNKETIIMMNKNKSIDLYREIYLLNFNEKNECRICKDIVYYYDSAFKIGKNSKKFELIGKSIFSKKFVEECYFYLNVCEKCLTNKFPEYSSKNKSRVFNGMNEITKFAFDIPEDISKKWIQKNYSITEQTLIDKYGEDSGKEKWLVYCEKQSISNTFEYKRDKYGWTKEQFSEYNKSRSVTLENLIKRHGFEKGTKIWDEYCEKQRYSTTKEYFIEKHGQEKGSEIYSNFVEKRLISSYSNISKLLFENISNHIQNMTIYFGENEYFFYDKLNSKFYLIDFYIKEIGFGIEFQGDFWHANPKKYKEDDVPIKFDKLKLTAKEIWERDRLKQEFLKTKLNKLIIIWESDLIKRGLDSIIEEILNEIK